MKEKDPVSLASLYGGAVLEAVDHELQNVLANIQDVNTSPVAARAVTLQIKIKPNKERNIASLTFQASSRLAPAEALESSILIDRDVSGRPVAFEMCSEPEDTPGVLPMFGMDGGRK